MIEAFKKKEKKKENLADGTYYLLDKALGGGNNFFLDNRYSRKNRQAFTSPPQFFPSALIAL